MVERAREEAVCERDEASEGVVLLPFEEEVDLKLLCEQERRIREHLERSEAAVYAL